MVFSRPCRIYASLLSRLLFRPGMNHWLLSFGGEGNAAGIMEIACSAFTELRVPERKHTRARAHPSEDALAAVGSQCLCNFLLNILTRTAQFWQNAWDCVNQMVWGCSVFPTANSSWGGRTGHCPQYCRQHVSGIKSSSLSIKIHTALSLDLEGEQVTIE